MLSYLRKNNTSEQNHPYSSNTKVSIRAFCLSAPQERERQDLSEIKFKFSDITKVNVLRSIKQKVKNEVKKNVLLLLFPPNPLKSLFGISFCVLVMILVEKDENEEKEKIGERAQINKSRTFKSNECVICLTNPPKNCGHLCLYVEYNEINKRAMMALYRSTG